MRLARLLIASFAPAPDASRWASAVFPAGSGSYEVRVIGHKLEDRRLRLILASEAPFPLPLTLTKESEVLIPDDLRRSVERGLETAANAISVAEGASRHLASPTPCLALIPEGVRDASFLEGARGIAVSPCGFAQGDIPIGLEDTITALADRWEGAALLAEALSQSHPVGRFRDCVRVFEHAFALSSKALVKPLSTFLAAGANQHGFDGDEVEHWIVKLRHQASHADLRLQSGFALERDISPFVSRAIEAAYDVLFNKAVWHDPSISRRVQWVALSGSAGPGGADVFITKGQEARLHFHMLDDFCAYSRDMDGFFKAVPDEWWIGPSADATSEGGERDSSS